MFFRVKSFDKDTNARSGIIETGRGIIETPVFMPVGSAGSVKGVSLHELENSIKASIILANTYHLYLRPGIEIIRQAGGIHGFTGWQKPILTDSGGYQVFSLADNIKLSEEGAVFRSHIDGSKHMFTPENVVDIQRLIGADIIMAFDECTPYPCDYGYAKKSMELTHRWLKRGWDRFNNTVPLYAENQVFFPIVQGGTYAGLRTESAHFAAGFDSPGIAIGGLSVGEPADIMYEMIEHVNKVLPEHKPRYLMGVGTPVNILEAVERGVDMFDCVMPTRNGRNGTVFTLQGVMNIKNRKWKDDFSPVDPDATTIIGTQYSRSYLRHLIVSNEILGAVIASIHNLGFYIWLVNSAREKIESGEFGKWKSSIIPKLNTRL